MTQLTEWQRRVALDIAQAFPLEPVTRIRARGNSLVAQNDEPEPVGREPFPVLAVRNELEVQRLREVGGR